MTQDHMDKMCDVTAMELGVPSRWVRSYTYKKLGKPCGPCNGVGSLNSLPCPKCGGSGGHPSAVKVSAVHDWIRQNDDEFRQASTSAPEKDPVAALLWKMDHSLEWEVVEGLPEGDFKRSMVESIEAGKVSPAQEEALHRMIRVPAPHLGASVDITGKVIRSHFKTIESGAQTYLIDVDARGWTCRVDIRDNALICMLSHIRPSDIRVVGKVQWRKENFAVVVPQSVESR